jgi:hypothetical protein
LVKGSEVFKSDRAARFRCQEGHTKVWFSASLVQQGCSPPAQPWVGGRWWVAPLGWSTITAL